LAKAVIAKIHQIAIVVLTPIIPVAQEGSFLDLVE